MYCHAWLFVLVWGPELMLVWKALYQLSCVPRPPKLFYFYCRYFQTGHFCASEVRMEVAQAALKPSAVFLCQHLERRISCIHGHTWLTAQALNTSGLFCRTATLSSRWQQYCIPSQSFYMADCLEVCVCGGGESSLEKVNTQIQHMILSAIL